MPRKIGNDRRVVLDQDRGQRLPHVSRVAETVQQQHRRPLAADADILRATGHLHLLLAKTGWKRFDLRSGGSRCD
jgi:hypothetical protein